MHKIIEGIGIIVAVIGVLVAVVSVANGTHADRGITGLLIGTGIALPGVVIFGLGVIVERLDAIRENTEKQLAIFGRLGKPRDTNFN